MLLIGAEIDFVPDGDTATEPVLVKKSSQEKSRYVAAFLALVLGIFGIDRFYLGWVSSGIAIAVVFIVTLVGNATLNSTPLTDIMTGDSNYLWKGNVQNFIWISAIFWALCRCVAYLSKSDQQFFDSYLSYEAMRVDS